MRNVESAGVFIPHLLMYTVNHQRRNLNAEKMEELAMKKGFSTDDGYMGLVEGRYILFASESDYYEYMND